MSLQLLDHIETTSAAAFQLGEQRTITRVEALERANPDYVAEARNIIRGVFAGDRRSIQLATEAMSTSDFSVIFSDTIDRQLLAEYETLPTNYPRYLRTSEVSDFRTVKRFQIYGGRAILDEVAQGQNYKQAKRQDRQETFSVSKYGRVFPFLWETLINDDLGAFRDMPSVLADIAMTTEQRYAANLWVANSSLYSTTHSVSGTNYSNKGTATLSVSSLETAITTMGTYTDDDGNPIPNAPRYLVVPTNLEMQALRILQSQYITQGGATSGMPTGINNVLQNRVELIVNPWIQTLDATNGTTSWYLFAAPTPSRYAVEVAKMRGYVAPQLFRKAPDSQSFSGNDPLGASFDSDTIKYKVRHIIGGVAMTTWGWRYTYHSDGTT